MASAVPGQTPVTAQPMPNSTAPITSPRLNGLRLSEIGAPVPTARQPNRQASQLSRAPTATAVAITHSRRRSSNSSNPAIRSGLVAPARLRRKPKPVPKARKARFRGVGIALYLQ